ncbi:MAG: hypothetical protein JWO87_675 [Phycisphaerales bacterium]|nr:hypothetical protein [Phycisphaerales bacterium]
MLGQEIPPQARRYRECGSAHHQRQPADERGHRGSDVRAVHAIAPAGTSPRSGQRSVMAQPRQVVTHPGGESADAKVKTRRSIPAIIPEDEEWDETW